MNNLNIDSLNKWFNDIQKIIFDVKVTTDNLNRLLINKSEYEKEILCHGFFAHYYRQSWFATVVQMSKLFSDNSNQKRSFNKLFNVLENFKYNQDLQQRLEENKTSSRLFQSREDILDFIKQARIKIDAKQDSIAKVIFLRDKVYAHSDIDPELPQINVKELTELTKLSVEIFNDLRGGIFDIEFIFEVNKSWSIDYPITMLGKQRKELKERYSKLGKKNE